MSNPFDDLDSDDDGNVDGGNVDDGNIDAGTTEQTTNPTGEPATESASTTQTAKQATKPQTTGEEQKSPSAEATSPADAGPGFEYSDVRQKPLYARDETWNELEDKLGIEVTPELRRMEIRDEETREVHDAILKVALEHIDEVPEQIHRTREDSLE
ncbi:hypothetical protein [Halostagnicola kamekurae]|uniref:Uncharacterized protein n=1 Tax=Halostagnicola kamekurae TaxID=619731 RepID=A0A1I6UI54_9EURY|nr:hypothetical protein [Halostagnicola kamekurae]SFT01156.1 hypothetical protein SAMN04488556_3897 [Halostagnicola kamekurae]